MSKLSKNWDVPNSRISSGQRLMLKSCHRSELAAKAKVEYLKKKGYDIAKSYKNPKGHCVYARKDKETKYYKLKHSPIDKRPPKRYPTRVYDDECVNLSKLKKYRIRPSPPYPANKCCGHQKVGNDGNLWVSKEASNGICRWIKVKEEVRVFSISGRRRRS